MLEEAAQRELEHLHRTHTCLPGLGSHCGEDPQPGAAAAEQPEPAGTADSWEADAPQPAGALGGGGGGAGLGPSIPGKPNSVVFVEGARWSGGAPAELSQEAPRRWRVRFSRAPSPVVGGPTLPSAASVGGGEEQNDAGGQQGRQHQQGAATKRQRKPRQQLKAGAVSLPAPEPPVPAAASEPPRSDATAAARWQEPPPLAPPMGGAAGQGVGGCSSTNGGILYADTPSQELLGGSGRGGGIAEAAGAEAEPAPQYRQPAEVLRLFEDDPPGARYSQPAAGALDVTFRASMPGGRGGDLVGLGSGLWEACTACTPWQSCNCRLPCRAHCLHLTGPLQCWRPGCWLSGSWRRGSWSGACCMALCPPLRGAPWRLSSGRCLQPPCSGRCSEQAVDGEG